METGIVRDLVDLRELYLDWPSRFFWSKHANKCAIVLLFAWILVIVCFAAATTTDPTREGCDARQISEGKMVCVCSKTYCDSMEVELPQGSGKAIQVDSSKSGKRFQVSPLEQSVEPDVRQCASDHLQAAAAAATTTTIDVKLDQRFQTIMGWGGAITDSAAINAYNLSKTMSHKLIESYYGQQGILYNFGRVPLGGSDFSPRAYTYDDVKDDYELKHWSLAPEDLDYKIPMIKEAAELCKSRGESLTLFSSPWSPPAWMKTNNNLVQGHLKDEDRVYKSYTSYLLKFYQAYKEHGIEFWGQTLENEPIQASNQYEFINSLEFNSSQQIKFVTEYFGPALEANGMSRDKFKLMVGDDSLTKLMPLVADVLLDPQAGKYFAGLAFHWYDSDQNIGYDQLETVYEDVQEKIEFLIMTEACAGNNQFSKKVDLGNWDRADTYAMDIIEDLHRHTGAWIDWNLALNRGGGPNWALNFVDSPIIVDETKDEFLKQPMYYALGHFSRFFRRGSVRVGATIDNTNSDDIRTVAVRDDSTGHLIVNVLNRSFRDNQVELSIDNGLKYKFEIEARSIKTVVVKL